MTKHGKTIIICEGVAGAGKTTLTRALESIDGISVVRASLEKREFQAHEASMKSQFNDYAKIVTALHDPNPVVIVERFVLSQAVYGTIRCGMTDRLAHTGVGYSAMRLFDCAVNEHNWRHFNFPPPEYFLGWIIIAPHVNVIESLRSNRLKEYPNNPEVESCLYRKADTELRACGEIVLMPSIDAPVDIKTYHEVMTDWMSKGHYFNVRGLFNDLIMNQWKG